MRKIEDAAIATRPRTVELHAAVPDELISLVSKIHLGLVEWFIGKIDETDFPFEDKQLLESLIAGFRQIGALPPSGAASRELSKFKELKPESDLDKMTASVNESLRRTMRERVSIHKISGTSARKM